MGGRSKVAVGKIVSVVRIAWDQLLAKLALFL